MTDLAFDPEKVARLRAARIARDAELAAQAAMNASIRDEQQRQAKICFLERQQRVDVKTAASFWDNIDTSGGEDACHPWTGRSRWNRDRYEEGEWREFDGQTRIARRHLIEKTFGCAVENPYDVSPICENYMCMNARHMSIVRHGGNREDREARAVPAEEYFDAKSSEAESVARVAAATDRVPSGSEV